MVQLAVVAGISNKLEEGYKTVYHAINAARRIKRCLIRQFGFRESNIVLLLDETDSELCTASNILQELKNMIARSNSGGTLLMFYIGHGGGDEPLTDDFTKYYMYCANDTTIDGSELLPVMNSVQEDRSLTVVLDCCNSGGIFQGLAAEQIIPYSENVILDPAISSNAIMISSCRSYQSCGLGKYKIRKMAYDYDRFYPKPLRKFNMKKAGKPMWRKSTSFAESFLKVAKRFNGDVYTKQFVECTVGTIKYYNKQQKPQLYCNANQANSKFLC